MDNNQNPTEKQTAESAIEPPKPNETISPSTQQQPTLPTFQATPPNVPQVISNNQKPKKRKPFLILLLIVVLAVGGWFAYMKLNKKENNADTQANAPSKDISRLRVGIQGADYGKLYPEMSTSEYSILMNSQIFEGLVRYENTNKIVPALATDWTNPDSRTWVFTIKKNVKFHDGHTLSASDVKYSLDKVLTSKSDLTSTFAGTISSVSLVGDDKIRLTTTDPDPTLLNKLSFLYIIDANLTEGEEPSMAGTGPYMVKSGTVPTAKDVQLTAFDGYHEGRPATRELSFGNEDTIDGLIKAFEEDKFDIVGSVPPDKAGMTKNATRFISREPDVNFIALNTVRTGPLQKKQVREAIRYAVDPVAIGKARGNETTPLSQMIPESIPGYNPAITPYKRDVNKSRQLLKQAGYPTGVTLKFSTSDTPEATAEIAKELKEGGITIQIDQHNDFDEFIDYFISGKAEMYTVDYSSDTLDGVDIYTTTISDTNYANPKFKKALDQAAGTVDPAARLKLLQDVALIVDQDVPVVPLSTEDNLWLMDKDYDIVQDMPSAFISVYFYKTQLK